MFAGFLVVTILCVRVRVLVAYCCFTFIQPRRLRIMMLLHLKHLVPTTALAAAICCTCRPDIWVLPQTEEGGIAALKSLCHQLPSSLSCSLHENKSSLSVSQLALQRSLTICYHGCPSSRVVYSCSKQQLTVILLYSLTSSY